MANEPLRSANKAYYASKQPLLIRGTKEGRKSPRRAPSYQQKYNDTTASSRKYYAEMESGGVQTPQPTGQAKSVSIQSNQVHFLEAHPQIMQDVVRAFQNGAGLVEIKGTSADINNARTAVDLAVGRNVLTREQADRVGFNILAAPAPALDQPPVEVPEAVAETLEAESAVLEAPAAEPVVEEVKEAATPEADAILNPPKEAEKPKRKRRTRKKKEEPVEEVKEEVTEADVAAAFQVPEDDDDSDDSDD